MTSKITSRVLFFDFYTHEYKRFIENSPFTGYLSMSFSGGGQIDFSSSGSIMYFSRRHGEGLLSSAVIRANSLSSSDSSFGGSVEAFQAQLGQYNGTLISSSAVADFYNASDIIPPSPFHPGALRVSSSHLYVADDSTNRVLLYTPFASIFSSTSRILDISVSDLKPLSCIILTVDGGIHYVRHSFDGDIQETLLIATIDLDIYSPRSLDYRTGDPSAIYVAVQPLDILGPHVLTIEFATGTVTERFLYVEDCLGYREGVDIQMLRAAPNGLLYTTERSFGLPLIVDPGNLRVIGQTGQKLGFLADSFSLTFSNNPFGKTCSVRFLKTLPPEIVAGEDYPFEVTLFDSNENPVLAKTYLTGVLNGENSGGSSTMYLQNPFVHVGPNVYRGNLTVRTIGRWSFNVNLAGLSMRLGNIFYFQVNPGTTSHLHTRTLHTSKTVVAGGNATFLIETYDRFGNLKNTGGDADSFSIQSTSPSVLSRIEDNLDGTYQMILSSELASIFSVSIDFDGEPIQNSPTSLVVTPSAVSATTTVVSGTRGSLEKFEDGTNEIVIMPKDSFENVVLGSSIFDQFNVTVTYEGKKLELDIDPEHNDGSIVYRFNISKEIQQVVEGRSYKAESVSVTAFLNGEPLSYVSTSTGTMQELNGWEIRPAKVWTEVRPDEWSFRITLLVSLAVVAQIFLYSVLCLCWWNENAIRFSQKKILLLILLGCFIYELGALSFSLEFMAYTDFGCKFQGTCCVFGFWCVLLGLAGKSWRVFKLAYNKKHKRIKITDTYLLTRIGVLLLLLIMYLLAYDILNPVYVDQVTDEPKIDKRGTKQYNVLSKCQWGDNLIWAYALGGVSVLLIGVVVVLATLTRKIPSAFSEAKWIMLSVYTLGAMCTCFGLTALVGDTEVVDPSYYLYSVVFTASISVASFLNFMFLPKFWNVVTHKKLDVSDLTKKINTEADDASLASGRSGGGSKGRGGGRVVGSLRPSARSSGKGGLSGAVEMGSITVGFSHMGGAGEGLKGGTSFIGSTNPMACIDESKQLKAGAAIENELRNRVKELENEVNDFKKRAEMGRSMSMQRRASGRSSVGTVVGSIPEGSPWQEYFDDEGYPYYFHTLTNECTYDRPKTWF